MFTENISLKTRILKLKQRRAIWQVNLIFNSQAFYVCRKYKLFTYADLFQKLDTFSDYINFNLNLNEYYLFKLLQIIQGKIINSY